MLCVFYIVLTISCFKEPLSTHSYHQLRNTFKTGDIVLFCCKMHDNMEKIKYDLRTKLLGSEYGHAGLVLRDNDDTLYVIECTDHLHTGHKEAILANNYKRGGIRLINMDILLKEYYLENNAVFAILPIKESLNNDLVKSKLAAYTNVIFENKLFLVALASTYFLVSAHLAQWFSEYFQQQNRMMCSEFVYHLLYQCGVMHAYPSKLFWPQSFTDGTLQKVAKVPYGSLIKMVYQPQIDTH